jgi:hypothetical protein
MEKNNIPHNTKLWVSFDSPHLGANIPIAAQENLYFFGYNGNQTLAKDKFDENFRSPAARQMLVEQLDGLHQEAPYSTLWNNNVNGQNNNTPFRLYFGNSLETNGTSSSFGYPQNLRKIALINGTTKGTKTNSEGQLFLELAAFKVIKYGQVFGTPIQTKIKVAVIKDRFLAPYQLKSFEGSVSSPGGGLIGINTIDGSVTRTNSNPRGIMDIIQGGTFNTQGIIKDQFTEVLNSNSNVNIQEWRVYKQNHSFIPTVSALAFKNPNFNWANPINRNLVCDPDNKEIHFDSYFAPSENEEHVFLTKEKVDWLLQELQGNEQDPYFPVNPANLEGADIVCSASGSTFGFYDLCAIPGEVANWSVNNKLTLLSSGAYEVVVKGVTGVSGWGTITATFQNGVTVSKQVWVGKPGTPFLGGASFPSVPANSLAQFSASANGATSYQWKMSPVDFQVVSWYNVYANTWQILSSQVNSGEIMAYTGNPGTNGTVGVSACNICGCSDWTSKSVTISSTGTGITDYFVVYPNPSSTVVNIGLIDENHSPGSGAIIRGDLFDYQGIHKGDVQIVNHKAVIDVSSLPKGIYILRISVDDRFEGHQIIVE